MTIDLSECRFCHRTAVQWIEVGDRGQTFGLCSRHATLRFQVEELRAALCDLRWALEELLVSVGEYVETKVCYWRRRWRGWRRSST